MALTPVQKKLLTDVLTDFLQLRNPITFMNLGSVLAAMNEAAPEGATVKLAAITQWLKTDPKARFVIDEAYRSLYGKPPG